MHNKLINTKMQEFKKRNKSSDNHSPFELEDKENIPLSQYERLQEGKIIQRPYLMQAEKLIMKQRMKTIVADNVQYFRNILQANEAPSPNKLILKLPGKFISTMYKTEFNKKQQYQSQSMSLDVKRNNLHHQKQNFSESKLPLTTTYQNEFKKFSQIESQQRINSKVKQLLKRSITKNNAPTFLDTQNMLQYRNWGTGSVMPSMKPKPQTATTQIPFKASSMYRTQFYTLMLPKTEMVTRQESYPQSIDLWMGKSSYDKDFQKRVTRCHDQSYRPKEAPGATNLPFKSTTEYKQSFLESVSLGSSQMKRKKRQQESVKKLSNMDIEKLVMDL